MKTTFNVLDKGYIRLVTWMPWNMPMIQEASDDDSKTFLSSNDLLVVNAARTSFLKESDHLSQRDEKLIDYLARNNENSPFRHAFATFEFKAPLFVARQLFKYRVGSSHTADSSELYGVSFGNEIGLFDDPMTAWNEASRRYLTLDPEFYIPGRGEWRSAPDNKKQGSGAPKLEYNWYTSILQKYVHEGLEWYNRAVKEGVAPEQARLFLPAYAMYIVWRWSASLAAICHMLNQRLEEKAQFETRQYAEAVYNLIGQEEVYPVSVKNLVLRREEIDK